MNPYEKLAEHIQEWDGDQTGNPAKRRLRDQRGLAQWEDVRSAFKWLVQVDRLSEGNPNREPLLEALWTYMVHPDRSWRNNEQRTTPLASSNLAHLLTLAEVHPIDPDNTYALSSQEISVLRETLELIKTDLVKHADALGKAGKRLQKLVDACLALLDEPEIDDAAVRAKTEQIFGAVIPASFHIEDEEERRSLVNKAAKALGVWARDVAAGASGSVAGNMIVRMITGG